MKLISGTMMIAALALWAAPALADTTEPPNLAIAESGKKTITVPVFDKWTKGATLVVGDLGNDGIPEIVVGAGPGSLPEIRILRQDGSLIKKFNAYNERFRGGVTVAIGDVNRDGINDIVTGAGSSGGPHVKVFDTEGNKLAEFFAYSAGYRGGVEVAAGTGRVAAAMLNGVDQRTRVFVYKDASFDLEREVPRTPTPLAALTSAAVATTTYTVPPPVFTNNKPSGGKEIVISVVEQRLYAYEDGALMTTFLISTGKDKTPTKAGDYAVQRKVAIKAYNTLKNVHWNTQVYPAHYIHEAYWHNDFGQRKSAGCINARLGDAKFIYDWSDIGTPVRIL